MSTGRERVLAKEMQREGMNHPLSRACSEAQFFRQVNREVTWGLTLNR